MAFVRRHHLQMAVFIAIVTTAAFVWFRFSTVENTAASSVAFSQEETVVGPAMVPAVAVNGFLLNPFHPSEVVVRGGANLIETSDTGNVVFEISIADGPTAVVPSHMTAANAETELTEVIVDHRRALFDYPLEVPQVGVFTDLDGRTGEVNVGNDVYVASRVEIEPSGTIFELPLDDVPSGTEVNVTVWGCQAGYAQTVVLDSVPVECDDEGAEFVFRTL